MSTKKNEHPYPKKPNGDVDWNKYEALPKDQQELITISNMRFPVKDEKGREHIAFNEDTSQVDLQYIEDRMESLKKRMHKRYKGFGMEDIDQMCKIMLVESLWRCHFTEMLEYAMCYYLKDKMTSKN